MKKGLQHHLDVEVLFEYFSKSNYMSLNHFYKQLPLHIEYPILFLQQLHFRSLISKNIENGRK